jgi:hypothetical protein
MQPHGISANIATATNERATFVNVMAFLHPCTVYSKQVTHSGISQHEQILDQAASSSADMVADARIWSKATKHRDCSQRSGTRSGGFPTSNFDFDQTRRRRQNETGTSTNICT